MLAVVVVCTCGHCDRSGTVFGPFMNEDAANSFADFAESKGATVVIMPVVSVPLEVSEVGVLYANPNAN